MSTRASSVTTSTSLRRTSLLTAVDLTAIQAVVVTSAVRRPGGAIFGVSGLDGSSMMFWTRKYGDHLHLNDTGYAAMAQAVDICRLLTLASASHKKHTRIDGVSMWTRDPNAAGGA